MCRPDWNEEQRIPNENNPVYHQRANCILFSLSLGTSHLFKPLDTPMSQPLHNTLYNTFPGIVSSEPAIARSLSLSVWGYRSPLTDVPLSAPVRHGAPSLQRASAADCGPSLRCRCRTLLRCIRGRRGARPLELHHNRLAGRLDRDLGRYRAPGRHVHRRLQAAADRSVPARRDVLADKPTAEWRRVRRLLSGRQLGPFWLPTAESAGPSSRTGLPLQGLPRPPQPVDPRGVVRVLFPDGGRRVDRRLAAFRLVRVLLPRRAGSGRAPARCVRHQSVRSAGLRRSLLRV